MVLGQRILVTGADGFIGRALCARAIGQGWTVYGLSRRLPEHPVPGVRYEQIDLIDAEAVATTMRRVKPAVVVHLAGEVGGSRASDSVLPMLHANLVAAVNVLLAAHLTSDPRVVLAGSMEEPDLGDPAATPQSPYAAAKWALHGYARMFGALYALRVVHLRVFMVYGPGQTDAAKLVPYVCRSLLTGVPPELMSGAREVDWVFIDDVVRAFLLAAEAHGVDGRSFDVGSGRLISVRRFVTHLTESIGTDVEPVFGAVPDRALERVRVADTEATATALGWRAEVSLQEGLTRTVTYYARRLPGSGPS